MSNTLYPSAASGLLRGDFDLSSTPLTVLVVDDTFTYDNTHDFLNDVPGGVRLGSEPLTGLTVVDGVLDANDVLVATAAALTVGGLILFIDYGGAESSSPLIAWIDSNTDGTEVYGTTTADGIVIPWAVDGLIVLATA